MGVLVLALGFGVALAIVGFAGAWLMNPESNSAGEASLKGFLRIALCGVMFQIGGSVLCSIGSSAAGELTQSQLAFIRILGDVLVYTPLTFLVLSLVMAAMAGRAWIAERRPARSGEVEKA